MYFLSSMQGVFPKKALWPTHCSKKNRAILYVYFLIHLQINGMLLNTGQSLVFRVDKENKNHVNITGGPLAYRYQFEEFYIHYGSSDHSGSEHTVSGYAFPAEVSIL